MVFFEVTDNANLEQLSVVLRFVDKNSKIREEVLDFQFTERTTGEVISQLIVGKLEQWGLDIPHCRGQEYDGASNMSSKAIWGVQGLISQKKIPKPCTYTAIRIYLISLSLSLSRYRYRSLPLVSGISSQPITECANFFNYSPKRQRCLEKVISLDEPAPQRTAKIRDLSWLNALSVYLQACDPDIFPNIQLLFRIACTISVTSGDNERSNGTLKLVKGNLRTTMTTKRLSGLV